MAKPKEKQSTTFRQPEGVNENKNVHVVAALIVFAIAFLLYANTLQHGFVLDDPLAIELNKNVTSGIGGIGEIIRGGYRENNFGGQLYRPVSLIQFAIEWQISPNNPFIHHLFNVLWYAASAVLVFVVLSQWFSKNNILLPAIVALLFAAHPIHTEVVANIKSRDEIMSLFFVLSSFWALGRYQNTKKVFWIFGSLMFYFFALISKESAVTMFPVFGMLSWWIYNKDLKSSIKTGIWFVVPVIVLMIIRSAIFGSASTPSVDIMDNPIVAASGIAERMATSMVILFKYLQLLFFPHPLSSDYSYTVIPLAGTGNIVTWLSAALHLFLLYIAFKGVKTKSFLSLAIFAYLMAISLFSQIPIVIGTMFGERLAYLPSFWFLCGLIFLILKPLNTELSMPLNSWMQIFKTNPVILLGVLVITFSYGFKTLNRNTDWTDNYTLFKTDAATYPNSVRLNNGAADQNLRKANAEGLQPDEINHWLTESEKYCQQIMKVKPVATAYLTLGNIRMKQKKYEEAIRYYDQVNDLKSIVDQNKAIAYRELGREAGEKEQNLPKSEKMLTQSLMLNESDAETWFLMGVLNGITGNHLKAAQHFEKAFNLKPGPEYAKNVIMAYQNLGNSDKVKEYQKYLTK